MIVITLTKNSSKTIQTTIKSLENQTLKDIFWLILDEKSKDDTLNLIKHSKVKHEIIKISSNGLFAAYNKAIKILKKKKINDIIFFLHSDDLIYDKYKLQNIKTIFIKKKISALIGNIVYFRNNHNKYFRYWKSDYLEKQIKIGRDLYKFEKFSNKDFIFGWSFPHTSFFFHSRILKYIPKYDENFKTSSDYGWAIEILLQNKFDVYFYDNFLVKMKSGGTSTKISNLFKQVVTDYKIIKKLFYKTFKDIFFCIIVLFSKKFRKLKQFLVY